ncbi:zinc-binding dehydrogenase [Brevifollis gellanilyticus]|uniref:alcohol dehydrogenase n=1 Tax=Brevifollis gellanilyticus TaxID=748831 RepID=A0A512MCD7_9BACT|nr:zinc-binding dehydrogenase [Brevifollis gellanilyticus]GEP44399.1 alcohol dehydrogenase [Brevifollis gellanilyticus]
MKSSARIQLFQGPSMPFEMAFASLPDELRAGEVLVQISLATICGSDLHTTEGRRSAPVPCVLGHEAVGHVVSSSREGVAIGQRVTWTLADSCGHCAPCTSWHLPQKCEHLFKYGHAALSDGSGLNGCYASHIVLRPGTEIMTVPAALPDCIAAPANCALATIVNALETLPDPYHSALVQGGGLLGIYACAWLKHRGVQEVYCTDLSPQRLALVAEFGGIPVMPGERMPQVDLVLEVTGSSAVIPDGVKALRPGGHYVWAGMVHPETKLDLTGEAVLRKCLTLRGVHNYAPEHLKAGLDFLAANHTQLPFEKLTSPALSLEKLNEGFELTRSRQWQRVAIQP